MAPLTENFMSRTVLVAGATGMLGQQIVGALLDEHAVVRMMVRGGKDHPSIHELSKYVARGAVIVDAELSDPRSLQRAVEGVNVVVSSLQGGSDVIINGQLALATAGLAEGVSRIFPSDFAVDFRNLDDAEHLFFSWRRRADAAIATIGLPQTNVFNGAFTEMLFAPFFGLIDWEDRTINYWGDADQSYDFTTTADTALYVAAAVMDKEQVDGALSIAGDTVSPRTLREIASHVSGHPFVLRTLGDIGALDDEIAKRQAASPHDPMPWAALQYHRAMATGRGKLKDIANARYPSINATSVLAMCETRYRSEFDRL
jgi:uncharacterized protein YbjT (DUF2867 family)